MKKIILAASSILFINADSAANKFNIMPYNISTTATDSKFAIWHRYLISDQDLRVSKSYKVKSKVFIVTNNNVYHQANSDDLEYINSIAITHPEASKQKLLGPLKSKYLFAKTKVTIALI